jgi:hypothetical protein
VVRSRRSDLPALVSGFGHLRRRVEVGFCVFGHLRLRVEVGFCVFGHL